MNQLRTTISQGWNSVEFRYPTLGHWGCLQGIPSQFPGYISFWKTTTTWLSCSGVIVVRLIISTIVPLTMYYSLSCLSVLLLQRFSFLLFLLQFLLLAFYCVLSLLSWFSLLLNKPIKSHLNVPSSLMTLQAEIDEVIRRTQGELARLRQRFKRVESLKP